MAAETQVPSGPWSGKGFFTELINDVNLAVATGVFATSDTVATALTNLANEQGKH